MSYPTSWRVREILDASPARYFSPELEITLRQEYPIRLPRELMGYGPAYRIQAVGA